MMLNFENKKDVQKSLLNLLTPLQKHMVLGGFHLGNTNANYSSNIASMEGFCRSLWGLAPLINNSNDINKIEDHYLNELLDNALSILKNGINEKSPGYWGIPSDCEQHFVEMTSVAFSILIAKNIFWDKLNAKEQIQLWNWLSIIQEKRLVNNNWHFFRIIVCTALRELGLPINIEKENESFEFIESLYIGDGWYQDGYKGNFDFYNAFAFHFYGLIYAKYASHINQERCYKYVERARLFSARFVAWFREDGAIVAYGRSLTYRFAVVSIFSACAFMNIEVVPWGVMKGIVLRHLRWWFNQPIFDNGGILTIGWRYPNLKMADNYNSPGSPYWALKVFLVLAISEDHPFWESEECNLPKQPQITIEKVPGFIITHTLEDVQLFTAGHYSNLDVGYTADKYAKFVYSARFGFSVSHSAYHKSMLGCDSTLLLSNGDGYWRGKQQIIDKKTGSNWLSFVWKPFSQVTISTTLISLDNWHVRIHLIKNGLKRLETLEGGFSIPICYDEDKTEIEKNNLNITKESFIDSSLGASRIIALDNGQHKRRGNVVKLAPNMNVMYSNVMVPVLEGTLKRGSNILITCVSAGNSETVKQEIPPKIIVENGNIIIIDNKNNENIISLQQQNLHIYRSKVVYKIRKYKLKLKHIIKQNRVLYKLIDKYGK